MKVQSDTLPAVRHENLRTALFCYDLRRVEVPEPDGVKQGYEYTQTEVPKFADYGTVISCIIRERYSMNDEIALLNNVSIDSPSAVHLAEFAEYQAYRAKAKSLARIFIIRARQELEAKTVAELTDIGQLLDMAERTDGFSAAVKAEKIDMLCDVLGVA
jgi:hypothetical protein